MTLNCQSKRGKKKKIPYGDVISRYQDKSCDPGFRSAASAGSRRDILQKLMQPNMISEEKQM